MDVVFGGVLGGMGCWEGGVEVCVVLPLHSNPTDEMTVRGAATSTRGDTPVGM